MSALKSIEAMLSAGSPITVTCLGGASALSDEADVLAESPFVDVLAALADEADGPAVPVIDGILLKAFERSASATALRAGASLVIERERLRSRLGRRVGEALQRRAEGARAGRHSMIAAYALEGLFRLCLLGSYSKLRFLAVLTDIGPEEDGLFLEHAAKLAGAAYHVWPERDLVSMLERLRENDDAFAEASFECGFAKMAEALDGASAEAIFSGLEVARVFFDESFDADPGRDEARAYSIVIRLVVGFASGRAADVLEPLLAELSETWRRRAFKLSAGEVPDWLKPRLDRDAQWASLAAAIPAVAKDLSRPSWSRPWEALARLLAVYDAERTVSGIGGVGQLVRPRIAASLARTQGLLAHLDDRLAEVGEEGLSAEGRAVALDLRAEIETLSRSSDPLGKPQEGALPDVLLGVLRKHGAPDDLAAAVERACYEYDLGFESAGSPVVQRIMKRLTEGLAECPDYRGHVKAAFDELVMNCVRFWISRRDLTSDQLGDRGRYLSDPAATEKPLQSDLRDWLAGNYRLGKVLPEVANVAKGRTDIHIGCGAFQFVVEVKRHPGHVDRAAARKYRGQAADYQATDVKLGILAILEVDRRRIGLPMDVEESFWNEREVPAGGNIVRHVVVFKVPGCLDVPSALSRPARQAPNQV